MARKLLTFGVLLLLVLPGCVTTPEAPAQPQVTVQSDPSPPTVTVRIDSTPDHATVYWSNDETGPWEVWKEAEAQHITPSVSQVPAGEYYWIKVSKRDYLDSESQFVRPVEGEDIELSFDLQMEPEKYAQLQGEKGLVLHEGQWVNPEAYGLIRYEGRWVDPEKEGLIQYRGIWIRPQDEGLVHYDGKWMTPAEREELREPASEAPGAEAAEPVGTVAEGLAAVRDNDLAAARQAAIDDALNNALQQHLGLHLKSSRVSENYLLMKYRIESAAAGVVDSYEVLQEASDGDIFWVRLRVVFREDMIRSKNLDKTRVMVAGDEVFVSDEVLFTSTLALQSITNALAEAGFRITPNPDSSWNLRADVFDASVFEKYRDNAKAAGADLLVVVNAKSQRADKFGNLITFNTNIEGRVVKVQTGEIAAANTMSLRGERKVTDPEAAEASLVKAGEAMADYMVGQVVRRYAGVLSHTLLVRNVKSRGQADLIVGELQRCDGVKSASLLEYSWDVARIEAELTPEANEAFPEYVNRLRDVRVKVIRSLRSDTVARVY